MEDLSLRNLFAMAALQGLLAGPTVIQGGSKAVVVYAYEIADAMLLEGAKAIPTWQEVGWLKVLMAELAEKQQKDAE